MPAFSVHEIDPRKACRIPYRLKQFSQNDDYINVSYAAHNRSRSEHLNESAKMNNFNNSNNCNPPIFMGPQDQKSGLPGFFYQCWRSVKKVILALSFRTQHHESRLFFVADFISRNCVHISLITHFIECKLFAECLVLCDTRLQVQPKYELWQKVMSQNK